VDFVRVEPPNCRRQKWFYKTRSLERLINAESQIDIIKDLAAA
jgi:hypothetical protein